MHVVADHCSDELATALKGFRRQALHARRLTLTHPGSGRRLSWSAPTPPDLAALLAGHDCDDSVGSFAAKYRDRTIEFDGFLGAMAPHDGAQTRFDLLINAGDFDPNKAFGPNFQFRDVNLVYDLHLTGTNVPDTLGIGQNLHVIAKVGEFDSFTCLFQLTPVATSVR